LQTATKLLPLLLEIKVLEIPKCAFGKLEWNAYFGDVGDEPPLPANIHEILSSHVLSGQEKK